MAIIYERHISCARCHRTERQSSTLPLNDIGEKMVASQEFGFIRSHNASHEPEIEYSEWTDLDERLNFMARAAGKSGR